MPRTQSASAIIERWQRHQTASEHMIAVRALFETSKSWARPCANSVVSIWSAYPRKDGLRHPTFGESGRSLRRPPNAGSQ